MYRYYYCFYQLIDCSFIQNPESRYSPAQKAAVLVYSRSIESGFEKGLDSGLSNRSLVTARLVVPSSQVGCLLGKGGAIISEMRKATGASIRIVGTDQVPKCASDNDQVVQVWRLDFVYFILQLKCAEEDFLFYFL